MNALARANWWLLLLTAGLLALLWFEPGLEKKIAEPVSDLDIATVQSATVLHDDETHVTLERKGDHWQMTHPEVAAVAGKRVDKLLHIATLPSLRHFTVAPDQLVEFGLDPPKYELLLDELRIQFGGVDPVTRARYIRTGNQVHLITDGYTHYLLAPAQEWLSE